MYAVAESAGAKTFDRLSQQFILAARPENAAKRSDFRLVKRRLPALEDGQVLFRNTLFSIDPYQRNLMGNNLSELPPINVGDPMQGPTCAVVKESKNENFIVGDLIQTWSGWQEYAISDGSDLRKLDPAPEPLSTALGPLGMIGHVAWFGMTKVQKFKPGGTVVITGAAGSIGSTAAQLAKLRGHRVVGVAGGRSKVAFLKDEIGLDEAIDYKADDFADQVERALPDGIDAFYENVGGPAFPVLMEYFNPNAKMVICGTIANYNTRGLPKGTDYLPRLITLMQYRFVDIKAFSIPFHMETFPEFLAEMTPLVREGRIKYGEEFYDGFEKIPETFLKLFDGSHSGKKMIVRFGSSDS